MNNPPEDAKAPDVNGSCADDAYEAPQVETVLTADDLVREIQYAGVTSNPG